MGFWQIIHLKRFQFFNGRWVKSQRSVSFPTLNLEPLRHTVENENGSNKVNKNGNGTIEIEDLEENESSHQSLKRPLTAPSNSDGEPPAKRSASDEEIRGEAKSSELTDGEGDDAMVDGEACEDDAAKPHSEEVGPVSTDLSEIDEILPKTLPRVYDLFATCVSFFHKVLPYQY